MRITETTNLVPVLKMSSLRDFSTDDIKLLTEPPADTLDVFEMLDGLFPEEPQNN